MLRIALIRPGSTAFDQQARIQGTLDVPLDEQGAAEVAQLVDQLRPLGLEVVYTSASQAAVQTAQTIAESLGIPCKKLENMQNLDHGLWQGMLIEDVRRLQPKVYRQWQECPRSVCPPQGEMLDEAEKRIRQAVGKLLRRHKEGSIGLVVPEPLASLVGGIVAHQQLGDLWKASCDHGSWQLLEVPATVSAGTGHSQS